MPEELRRDAELLLSHLLSVKPWELYFLNELPREVLARFNELLRRRLEGQPLAYLIGEWDCMGRTFKLEPGVLVPRPETELLIEKVLERIKDEPLTGLEIGVGSGCIAVNLLLERPGLKVTGVDVSEKALRVAALNAERHGVTGRLKLLKGDLYRPVEGQRFDFIVSNPPYLPEAAWPELPPEVRAEDKTALVAGRKGTEVIERIVRGAPEHLKRGGWLFLEIGHDQGAFVEELLRRAGFTEVNIFKDYAGQDRVAVAQWS
ncbi:MAG: peptide chain release factor N(5)-glutamine methyltransferase [Aquificae bacterium]|nr:peptide chain release factor N(5)-glutamine methyltransferase [Aquificota bacterium]